MNAQNTPKNALVRKSRARRIVKWSLAGLLLLLVVVFLGAPVVASSEGFRKYLLAKINRSVAGRTDFADLSVGWLKGVKVEGLSFDDSSGQVSVKVKQIHTKPHYAKLIGGNLSFGTTTIDEPRVEINLKDKPASASPAAPQPGSVPTEAAGIALVTDVVINDGSVKVTDAHARTAELSSINSKIGLRAPGKTSTLELDTILAAKAGASEIQAAADVTPVKPKKGKGWTLEGATGSLAVKVKDLDLESIEPLLALSGTEVKSRGRLSADLKSEIKNGRPANVTGKITGSGLDVTAPQLKGDRFQTKVLDADVKVAAKDKSISIDSLKLKTDWASLSLSGSVPTDWAGEDNLKPLWESDVKGSFDCDLPAVASLMPNTLGLKEGTEITSGRITGEIQTVTDGGKKQIKTVADLSGLKGTVSGKPVALSQPVQARVLLSEDKDTVKFDQAGVTSSFANIKASGTMKDIRYDADMDLAKLQSELGQFVDLGGYKLAGRTVETGQITIEPNHITVNGDAQVTDLAISSPNNVTASEPKAALSFGFEIDQEQNILALNTVTADASFGKVNVKDGVIPLGAESKKAMKLGVNASSIDLAKLRPFAVVFGSLSEDKVLRGIAEAQIDITSQKDTYKIATGNTKIRNIEYGSAGQKPFKQSEVSLVGDAVVNTTEKQYAVKAKMFSDAIEADLDLANVSKDGQSQLKGKAGLKYDAAAVGDMVSGYLSQDVKFEGKRTTSVEFASQYPADDPNRLMANLSTSQCTFGFDKAGYRGFDVGRADVKAQFAKGVLTIAPFTTSANGGQISLGGRADFTGPSPVISIPQPISMKGIQINETLSREFKGVFAFLNPAFKDALGVGGTLDLSAEKLEAPLGPESAKRLQVTGSFAMANVRFTPVGVLGEFFKLLGLAQSYSLATVHPTNFTVKDGFLRYDDAMRMDLGKWSVYYRGRVGLDKSLDMQVELPISGVAMTLPLTGTIDSPVLDKSKLGENILQNTLKGLLDKEGKGLLDGLLK
ncbi:MAG: hypothetical protein JXN61_13830 [Sedimentisphaerales bacterium]|nr:hypothetical protein [Sedimentisphaerales bacterium]